ncbi:hypothetical protein [Deinococcus sp.]|uniref:hypothetical protein n=1 Tax=Deinococcus sp. TaxID=47478 RepID=UPI00286E4983|nr:hypothetical protein [Deinococcus sp.]
MGVLPPPELSARILAWQRALGHVITTPHITLKAPGGLNAPAGPGLPGSLSAHTTV